MIKLINISFVGVLLGITVVQAQDASRGQELYKTCVQCHGDQGQGLQEKVAPRIAGQYDWYIVSQLQLFKKKERHNPEMYPFISNLNDKDFKDLAAYVSTMKVSH
jgi:cytochrome c553